MNPYEARPSKIPRDDLYWDLPLYGRYCPTPGDFVPLAEHCNSSTPESLRYWEKVLYTCNSSNYVYQNPFGGRDEFALDSIIVKSGHLKTDDDATGTEPTRDYSITDANEVEAIKLVADTVRTPRILFAGKIKDHDVLIQSRIPGIGLTVAWPYLSDVQKASFKSQTRDILRKLNSIQAPPTILEPTYIVPDADAVVKRHLQPQEVEWLLQKSDTSETCEPSTTRLILMPNDLGSSNILVNDD